MIRRSIPALLLVAGVLACSVPAFAASEGGLIIFSDIGDNLMNGDGQLWKTPWKAREVQLIVLFAILIWPANKFLFGPLLSVLDERGERIEGAQGKAKQLSADADEILGRYESAIESARKDAEVDRRGRLDDARREMVQITGDARSRAEQQVTDARAQLESTLDQARTQLRGESQALAREAASRVLGRSLS